MHERGIADDLVTRAEEAAGEDPVATLRFRIGALAGVTRDGLSAAVADTALTRWGYVPQIVIELDEDITDDQATGVVLSAVTVDG